MFEGVPIKDRVFSAPSQDTENQNKIMIAELNEFLAHAAPVMEWPEGLHVKIFENVRQSTSVQRAQKNWEGLTLMGVAASFLLLLSLGWNAAPNLRRRAAVTIPTVPIAVASSLTTAAPLADIPAVPLPEAGLTPIALGTASSSTTPSVPAAPLRRREVRHSRARKPARRPRMGDHFVAQDRVVGMAKGMAKKTSTKKPPLRRPAQPTTTSEVMQPADMRSTPVKRITDLK